MITYVAGGLSFQARNPGVVAAILACPTIEQILFPAFLPGPEGQAVRLSSPQEFDIEAGPRDFVTESFVRIQLRSQSGVEFSATIHLDKSIVPSVFNLIFSSDHLQKGILSFDTFRALLDEVIPVFRCDYFSVYPEVVGRPIRKYFHIPGSTNYYPVQLGWMAYFGKEPVEFLTQSRFDALQSYNRVQIDSRDGILIALQEEPFDPDNPAHWELEAKAISELGLERFALKRW